MAEPDQDPTIAERLGHALDRGQLPAGGPAEAAERLIERLQRPVRVALLGLAGAGKTAILNLLAGEPVVPEDLRLPTILVQRGSDARMICTLADGSSEVVDGADLEQTLDLQPALVTLELDLPALTVISLLEVAASAAEPDQRRAMAWASKRADIVVWCSAAYLPREQLLWETLPDQVKDNGFLFLTKTDLLGGKEAVAGIVNRIEQRAGEEFRRVLPISALKAGEALQADGGIDRDLFRESGASAVISAIKSRVDMARRADADTAEALLARYGTAQPRAPRRAADPVPVVDAGPKMLPDVLLKAAAPSPPAEVRTFQRRVLTAPPTFAPPVYQPPTIPRPTLEQKPAGLAKTPDAPPHRVVPDTPVRAAPTAATPRAPPLLLVPKTEPDELRHRPRVTARPAGPTAIRELISLADRAVVNAALAALRDGAERLAICVEGSLADAGKLPVEEILDQSHATTEALAEILSQGSARPIRRIAGDLGEIQDLVLLMKLEKGMAPAEDAITLLLQIRRDLETLLAA